ncbi:unnamed protein product [Cylicocyclus nassatus]|uniref:Uncharacterized protein n=1 Tax=Cylicocyclus nassatus TaxID=53992 RepID=A0AA36MCC9_CYLNA|nr:unnamed protein product [Cylicocyclus nassatus]
MSIDSYLSARFPGEVHFVSIAYIERSPLTGPESASFNAFHVFECSAESAFTSSCSPRVAAPQAPSIDADIISKR